MLRACPAGAEHRFVARHSILKQALTYRNFCVTQLPDEGTTVGIVTDAVVAHPPWLVRFKPQARALLGYLLLVIGFMIVPSLVAETHDTLADSQWTIRRAYTVQFYAIPETYRAQAGFRLAARDPPANVHCVPLHPASDPAQLPGYRCEEAQVNPKSKLTEQHEFFPASDGWVKVNIGDTDFEFEQPEVNYLVWSVLFTLLVAMLYWRSPRVAREQVRCSAMAGIGGCALVVAGITFIDWGLYPWMDPADYMSTIPTLLTVASSVVVGPVIEELVFRGFGWRILQPAFPLWMVVLLTSVTFTLGHSYSWAGQLTILAAGLGLAWLRIRTGSVGWCIAAHAAMNARVLIPAEF